MRPWFVVDEGGAIAAEAFPGVAAPIGVVGVTEKGVTSLELRVDGRGGHASTPARNGPTAGWPGRSPGSTATRWRRASPSPTVELLRRMAPHATRALRPLLANAARMRPVLTRALIAAGPEPAAMTRTTFAVTTLSGSPALNVIASTARAGVNIRIMVGDTVAGVLEHVRRTIDDDQVQVEVIEAERAEPGLADRRRRVRAARGHDHRGVPRRGARAVRHDGRHRLAVLHRGSAPGSTGSPRSG